MKFASSWLMPSTLERLWKVYTDPRYAQRRPLVLGADTVTLRRFVATPRQVEVELEREGPVAQDTVPSWLRTWFGSRQAIRERTVWCRVGDRRIAVDVALDPVGQPLAIRGEGWLTETIPGIVRMKLDWDVASSLTALGDQVERVHADLLWSMLRRDRAFTLRCAYAPAREPVPRGEGERAAVAR